MITVNATKLDWREGMTVAEVMAAMNYTYVHIIVTVNDEFVAEQDYDTHAIPDGAELQAIHIFHGG